MAGRRKKGGNVSESNGSLFINIFIYLCFLIPAYGNSIPGWSEWSRRSRGWPARGRRGGGGGGRRWTHWKSHLAFMAVPSISSIQLHPRRDRMEGEGGRRRRIGGGVILGCCWWREWIKSNVFPPLPSSPSPTTFSYTHTHAPIKCNPPPISFASLSFIYLFYSVLLPFFFHYLRPVTCSRRFDYSTVDQSGEMKRCGNAARSDDAARSEQVSE